MDSDAPIEAQPTGAATLPPRTVFIAALATALVGQLGLIFSAFLLPFAMAQGRVDAVKASEILAFEFTAYFLTALLASSVRQFHPARTALFACIGYAIGSFASAATSDFYLFAAARTLCGIGGGAVMVSANRAVASHIGYERIFAFVLIGTSVFGVFGLVTVPGIFENYGSSLTYATLGMLAVVAAMFAPWLATGTRSIERVSMNFGLAGFVMLSAYFFSRLSDAALWPYNERFGERVGMGASVIGFVFAGSAIVAVVGPLVALRFRKLLGVALLFSAVLLAKAASPTLMTTYPSQATFVIAQFTITLTYVIAGQLFLTFFSKIDATGRLAGLAGTVGLAADAGGLGVSGQSFAAGSFDGIAIASGAIGIAAWVLCLFALIRQARNERSVAIGG
ncbi:MAG: hypothetical protein ACKVOP_00205 [Sphingomonadaceae bacterium]